MNDQTPLVNSESENSEKSIPEKILDLLISNKFIKTVLTLLVLGIFHKNQSNTFELITKSKLLNIHGTFFLDLLVLLITFSLTLFLIQKLKVNYIASFNQWYFGALIVGLYSYFRFFNVQFIFQSFSSDSVTNICYLDVILLLWLFPLGKLTLFVKEEIKKKRDKEQSGDKNFFIEDNPIEESKFDTLNRTKFAKLIAEKINSQHFQKSFSIGITGSWGSGKSSFLNLLREHFQEDKIIIHFFPNLNKGENSIINEFFISLKNATEKYNSNLSSKFDAYAKRLVDSTGQKSMKSIYEIFELIQKKQNKSVSKEYEEIDEEIKRIEKQIIVFIDEVDRLNYKEILGMLNIIRNTANFSNIVFIVAYDKTYLLKCLTNNQLKNPRLFLEKYFQLEFPLPTIDKKLLKSYLLELLKSSLISEIKILENHLLNTDINTSVFYDLFHTKRGVINLCNSIKLTQVQLKSNTFIIDLFNLEILKVKFQDIYLHFAHNLNQYLEIKQSTNGDIYQLLTEENSDGWKLINDLRAEKFYLQVSEADITSFTPILNELFPVNFGQLSHLSILNYGRLNSYFDLMITENLIDEEEFNDAFNGDEENFHVKIKTWVQLDKTTHLVKRFIQKRSNLNEIIKVINSIFYLSKVCDNKEDDLLINELGNIIHDNYLKPSRVKSFEPISNHIISQHLEKASYPYRFERSFLSHLIKDNESVNGKIWDIPVQEWKDMQLRYFKDYINKIESYNEFNGELYQFYHSSKSIDKQETNKVFIQFLEEKGLMQFLSDIIDIDPYSGRYRLSTIISGLFESIPAFKEFVDENTNSKDSNIIEFYEFYEKCELNTFDNTVIFDFQSVILRDYKLNQKPSERSFIDMLFNVKLENIYNTLCQYDSMYWENKQGERISFVTEFPSGRKNLIRFMDYEEYYDTSQELLNLCLERLVKILEANKEELNFKGRLHLDLENHIIKDGETTIINLHSIHPRLK